MGPNPPTTPPTSAPVCQFTKLSGPTAMVQNAASRPAPTAPLKAGVYDALQPFEATTHNLEHGGIVIVYSGLSVGEADQLKQFVKDTISKTKYAKVLVMPYPALQGAKVTAGVITATIGHAAGLRA